MHVSQCVPYAFSRTCTLFLSWGFYSLCYATFRRTNRNTCMSWQWVVSSVSTVLFSFYSLSLMQLSWILRSTNKPPWATETLYFPKARLWYILILVCSYRIQWWQLPSQEVALVKLLAPTSKTPQPLVESLDGGAVGVFPRASRRIDRELSTAATPNANAEGAQQRLRVRERLWRQRRCVGGL